MDQPYQTGAGELHETRGSRMSLLDAAGTLRKRWKLFLGIVLGVVALVMLVTFAVTPVWESEASIRVRSESGGGLQDGLGSLMGEMDGASLTELAVPGLENLGGADVQTEIGVLASRRIVESVADSLALHVALSRPWREYRTDILHVIEAGEAAPEGVFTLRLEGDGTYSASSRWTDEPVELPDEVRIGEPFRVGPMTLRLDSSLASDPPRTVRFDVTPFRRMMRDFREDLVIERNDAGSRLIEIGYRHPDPHLARAVVNGIVDRFLSYSDTLIKSDPRREARILEDQVRSYGQRLADVEDRLETFQERERIVAPEEQAALQVERVAELQVNHDAMVVEREGLAELLREVREEQSAASSDTLLTSQGPYRQLATFPTFITNNSVQSLLQTLTNLENRRAELLVRRTPENIDVRMIDDRIRAIEGQLHAIATDYLESLDTQLAATSSSLDRFSAELEEVPAVELEYARLRREQRLLTEIYAVLQSRLAAAQVRQAVDDAPLRVVDRGVIEDRPAFPRPEISLALSGALGLMLGLFGVIAVESTSPRVRSREDAEQAAAAPVWSVVPSLEGQGRSKERSERRVLLLDDPYHRAAEELRGLALRLLSLDPRPRRILVAGPGPGEGRSTVAANLAVSFARHGNRTALVDADLRDGDLQDFFGVPDRPGWVEAAPESRSESGVPRATETGADDGPGREVSLETVARNIELNDSNASGRVLHLFPRGRSPAHPMDVLSSRPITALLEELEERYDILVLDTPALSTGHDATAVAPGADAVLLVARIGHTERNALERASEVLSLSGETGFKGLVLTSS